MYPFHGKALLMLNWTWCQTWCSLQILLNPAKRKSNIVMKMVGTVYCIHSKSKQRPCKPWFILDIKHNTFPLSVFTNMCYSYGFLWLPCDMVQFIYIYIHTRICIFFHLYYWNTIISQNNIYLAVFHYILQHLLPDWLLVDI